MVVVVVIDIVNLLLYKKEMILFLSILLITIFLDLILRKEKVSDSKLKFFETSAVIVLLLYLIISSGNFSFLAILGTTLISLAWVFKELFANIGATILMQIYPQFEKNDVLLVEGHPELLIFEDVGLLRSVLKTTYGSLVYMPNRTLLNETVTVS